MKEGLRSAALKAWTDNQACSRVLATVGCSITHMTTTRQVTLLQAAIASMVEISAELARAIEAEVGDAD